MRINGHNRLACKTLLKDLNPAKPITVEPIKGLPVLKDLVVDMEPFFDAYRSVMPFLITNGNEPTRERLQSPGRPRALRRHHQVHPVRRVHDVVPGLLDRRAVLRPGRRSSTRTGSSSTAATRAPTSGWRSSTTRRACGAAAPPSTAPRPAPAASRSPRRSRRSSGRCSPAPSSRCCCPGARPSSGASRALSESGSTLSASPCTLVFSPPATSFLLALHQGLEALLGDLRPGRPSRPRRPWCRPCRRGGRSWSRSGRASAR